jgi:pilus assembly protein Flp/PilA
MKFLTRIQARVNSMQDEEGATAVEYGLMVSLIAVVIIAGVALVGTNLLALFNGVAGHLVLPAAPPVG